MGKDIEKCCETCKYSAPMVGALCCMGQKGMPYVRPTDSCESWKSDKQTNYDRLISKTPKELAEWITDQIIDRNIGIPPETWLAWLQQEVDK